MRDGRREGGGGGGESKKERGRDVDVIVVEDV
jgi:hypothetical protein